MAKERSRKKYLLSLVISGQPQNSQKRIFESFCKVCSIEDWLFKKFCSSKQSKEETETNRAAILHNLKLAFKNAIMIWTK